MHIISDWIKILACSFYFTGISIDKNKLEWALPIQNASITVKAEIEFDQAPSRVKFSILFLICNSNEDFLNLFKNAKEKVFSTRFYVFFVKPESVNNVFDVHSEGDIFVRSCNSGKARWVEKEEIFSSVCVFIFPKLRKGKPGSIEIE